MMQHILLGDLAPLALLGGLTRPVLRPLLRFVHPLRRVFHPFAALGLWALNLYVWHLPFLYEAALRHDAVHALEHSCFFTGGILMWTPVLETIPMPEWFGTGAKLGYVAVVRVVVDGARQHLHLAEHGLLLVLRARVAAVRDVGARRPAARGQRDDGRGLARDDHRARVALPAARRGGRAAAAPARERPRSAGGAARRALRPRAGVGTGALKASAAGAVRPASITSTSSSRRSSGACRSTGTCSRRSATTGSARSRASAARRSTTCGARAPRSACARRSRRRDEPYDRYAVGLHHLAVEAASRAAVDERAEWLRATGAEIESGPQEYVYSLGYYAVFFYDPDGIKLEIVHVPRHAA